MCKHISQGKRQNHKQYLVDIQTSCNSHKVNIAKMTADCQLNVVAEQKSTTHYFTTENNVYLHFEIPTAIANCVIFYQIGG